MRRLLCKLGKHKMELIHVSERYELSKCRHCGIYMCYNVLYKNVTICYEFKYLPLKLQEEMKN